MNQSEQVLKILKKEKSISHLKAQHYQIGCIRKVISMLRDQGHNIQTLRKRDQNGKAYTSWALA